MTRPQLRNTVTAYKVNLYLPGAIDMQNVHVLRAFVTLAREGSVSRAAERLHLTQPAVSLKIKQLQQDLQLTLFRRHPYGLELTADGQHLLPFAEQVLVAIQAFEQRAGTLRRTLSGRLRIGTILDPEFIRLGTLLRHLVKDAPQIETELSHGMSGNVLKRVRNGDLDVGFYLASPGEGTASIAPEMAWRELTRFYYLVVAPPGWEHRISDKDWHELARLPWVVTPPDSVHGRLLDAVMRPFDVEPNRVTEVDQEACMLDLVRAGVGLSLARDALAMTERQERGLVVAETMQVPCALGFICRQDRCREPVIAWALEMLDRVWDSGESVARAVNDSVS